MTNEEAKKVIERYSERLKKFGPTHQTLGWDKKRHRLRYKILLSNWEFKKDETILDFGCGFGEMSEEIAQQNLPLLYSGCDINGDLIAAGNKLYPNINLMHIDFLADENKSFDYIVSSGVHNLKLEDNWSFIEDTFEKFSRCSKKGFAINFISNKVDPEYIKDHLYYCDPSKILELAYKYSKRVILRNDYMPFEFTIFINLNDEFDKDLVVYESFKSEC